MKKGHPFGLAVAMICTASIFLPTLARAVIAGFDTNWPPSITVSNSSNQISYSNLPVLNVTGGLVTYVSSTVPTNQTGFAFISSPGFTDPIIGDGAGSNNLILNFTPGTNANAVTNTLTITITNVPGGNGVSTNLNVVVIPPPPPPPYLEIRFYNSSTNPASNVFILPSAKQNPPNPNFWWTNSNLGGSNNWTNHMGQTKNMTVSLAEIGVTGTNQQNMPYYSVYTTNFNNAAWWISYGGGHLPVQTNGSGEWNGNTTDPGGAGTPTAADAAGPWAFSQWNAFEVTLAGSPADVGDITYINQFSIPFTLRVFTNSTTDSSTYFQHSGWTNFSSNSFNLLVSNLLTKFSNAVGNWRSYDGVKATLIAFPSSAAAGTLVAPIPLGGVTNDTQNAYQKFTDYFDAVKANSNRTNVIGDMIAVGDWHYTYGFKLAVTASNTLKLSGDIVSTNISTHDATNTTGLVLEIGADDGAQDNWASWSVYTAPTTANFLTVQTNGVTNPTVYSSNANTPVLRGTPVLNLGGGWAQLAVNTGTATNTALTNTVDFYSSEFGAKVIGRIMGDLAAGFAIGFINSDVINPSYTTNATNAAYGDSPSGSWWGGNQYPSAKTNDLAFGDVQPALSMNGKTFYSEFAGMIFSNGTKLAYIHPIYDRMQIFGAVGATEAGTPEDVLQPSSATNGVPPIWVVELEMFNGVLSAPQPELPPAPGAIPVFYTPTNSYVFGIVGEEGHSYSNFVQLGASNMVAPSAWIIQGLPAGLVASNATNGGVVYGIISGTPAAGSGAAGQDGGRVYALTMIMSNSYGLIATNVSSPANPRSCYLQMNTTNGQDPASGVITASPAALSSLTTTQGAPSAANAYLVSGLNLSNSTLQISAPDAFEVSTNSETGFGASLILTATNGTGGNSGSIRIAATPVFVRLLGAPSGTFTSNVTNSSGGLVSSNVAVSGVVAPLETTLSYGNWLTNYPSLSGANTNAAADSDFDAFSNAMEYAYGGDPTLGSPALLAMTKDASHAVCQFVGLKGGETNYIVQATADLKNGPWTNMPSISITNASDQTHVILPAYYQRREFVVPVTATNTFLRIKFVGP